MVCCPTAGRNKCGELLSVGAQVSPQAGFPPGSLAIEGRSFVVGSRAEKKGGGIYNEEGGTLSIDLVFSVFGNNPDNVFDANV